jgi:glutaredoxin
MDQLRVVIYAKRRSLRCWFAKRLLRNKGYAFEVVEASSDRGLPPSPSMTLNGTVPLVFLDGRLLGGLAAVRDLDRSGDLDRLVRGEV